MVVCVYCEREMKDGISCIEIPFSFIENDGAVRTYAPVRYGAEKEDWGAASGHRCLDCGCRPGDIHHTGCDRERCPRCGGQAVGCECFRADSTEGSDARTLFFYRKEAAAYAERSEKIGPSKMLAAFTQRLPKGVTVLDLGCGTGRDTKALLDAGFTVTALDASMEMIVEAEKRIGIDIRFQYFEDLSDVALYDGIWANASLLHVPRAGLPNVLTRVHDALKPGGLLFASFKTGGKEGRDSLGRYYNYLNADEAESYLRDAGSWSSLDITEGPRSKGYDGTESGWIAVVARKAPDGAL